MKPDIKEKWIAALESGEYIKGERLLKSSQGKYCCLGVLCDLHRKETGKGEWKNNGEYEYQVAETRSDTLLPRRVAEWAEIDFNPKFLNAEGRLEDFKGYKLLTDLNDAAEGGDFSPMIEAIEKYF